MTACFVGRQTELELLSRGLTQAAEGAGRLYLISGEAGIGKTTLADELARRAAAAGSLPLWGRCWESGAAPPFWPWVQILRGYAGAARSRSGEAAADLAHALLLSAEGDNNHPTAIAASDQARFALFARCWEILSEAERSMQLVLLIDDLHAADTESMLLLHYIAREIGSSRLLCVATCRSGEARLRARSEAAMTAVQRLAGRIDLRGFNENETAEVLEREFHIRTSEAVLRELLRVTDGNPFFVDEVVRMWRAQGHLLGDSVPPSAGIPAAVREVIAQHLRALPDRSREILGRAAIVGRDFELTHLAFLGGDSPSVLESSLKLAEEAGIVQRDAASGRFSFSHNLVREALLDDLGVEGREHLHQLLAEDLERRGAQAPVLAYHFGRAGRASLGKAIRYSRAAGQSALRSLAHDTAAEHFRAAIAHLDQGRIADEKLRCELLVDLGDANARAWATAEAKAALVEAAEIARRCGLSELLARAALTIGALDLGVPRGIADPETVTLLEEALTALGDANDPLRTRLLSRLASELFYSAECDRREALTREAVAIADRLDDASARGHALGGRHFALWGESPPEERLALADEIIRQAEQCEDRDLELQGRTWRTLDLVELGDVAALDSELLIYRRRAEALRQPRYLGMSSILRGLRAQWEGRFEETERLALEAMEVGQRLGRGDGFANASVLIFGIRRDQGRLAEVAAVIEAALARSPHIPTLRCLHALVCCELGRHADARTALEMIAANDFQDWWARPWRSSIIGCLTDVCAALGDVRVAAALYELAAPHRGHHMSLGPNAYFGPVDHHLGVLAATLGRRDEAAGHFEAATRMSRLTGGSPWLVRTRVAHAEFLIATGDSDHAAGLLEEAAGVAATLGMTSITARIATLRDSIAHTDVAPGRELASAGTFRIDGDYWTIEYGGRTCRLKDSKGLRYLAQLLELPDVDVHIFDLAALTERRAMEPERAQSFAEDGLRLVTGAGAPPLLDDRARLAYKQRLESLRDALESARDLGASDRVTEIQQEIDFVARELADGLGVRTSSRSSAADVLRQNISRAIKAAIDKIAAHNPELGIYLTATIKKGIFCSYAPDRRVPVRWTIRRPAHRSPA